MSDNPEDFRTNTQKKKDALKITGASMADGAPIPAQMAVYDRIGYIMIEPKYEQYLQRIDAKLDWLMQQIGPKGRHHAFTIDAQFPISDE